MEELTYTEHGWSQQHRAPDGYRVERQRIAVGTGEQAYTALAGGIMGWQLHRLAGLRGDSAKPRAAGGVRVAGRVGLAPPRLRFPCEVVWAGEALLTEASRRTGFGYGTLPGHPE